MEAIRRDDFLARTSEAGVGFDERYPDSGSLCLLPHGEFSRFWVLPETPGEWPRFVASLLDGLDPWSVGILGSLSVRVTAGRALELE